MPRGKGRRSLRRTLTLTLLAGMLVLLAAELMLARRTAAEAADAAYDRSLLGAIKAIDANISTASGGLGVELPYRMLEFFQLTASGEVYYRVATEDGLVEIGDAYLPQPEQALASGQPQFHDARYFGEPIRLASYARVLERPIAGHGPGQRVLIQVAESLGAREQFTRGLVLHALARDLLLLLTVGALLLALLRWALRPLQALRGEVLARKPQDLTPIATAGIPIDVLPLVEAVNHHVARNRELLEARGRFIDDASHQLRTPLATLATQLGFALREPDPGRARQALLALKQQLDETVRQTNQMLALARADHAPAEPAPTDLLVLARALTRKWWPEARDQQIDLGLDAEDQALWVRADPTLLAEAGANLLHNALRYTPAGGQVTLVLRADAEHARLSVVDSGPGIPAAELDRAGERFFRASNASQPGSGLGLAIVRSIAERHGGRLEILSGPRPLGLTACMVLPRLREMASAGKTRE